MKIVLNKCYGGFSISIAAAELMAARGNKQAAAELAAYQRDNGDGSKNHWYGYGHADKGGYPDGYNRQDPDLIAAVEQLGEKANGSMAKLRVIEIPDDISWEIDEYDGIESVSEKHRSWH